MTSPRKLLVVIQNEERALQLCRCLIEEPFEVESFRDHQSEMPSDENTLCDILKETTKQLRIHFLVIEHALLNNMDKSSLKVLCDDLLPTCCIFLTADQIAPSDAMRVIRTRSSLIAHEQASGKNHLMREIDGEYSLPILAFEDRESVALISKVAKSLKVGQMQEVHEDEIKYLLEHLCLLQGYEKQARPIKIRLRPATQTIGKNLALDKREMRTIALLLEIDGRYPLILKFASRDKVIREEEGYKRIKGYIASLRHARIESSVLGWHAGGLVYTLVGASIDNSRKPPMTFGEFYNGKSAEEYKEIEHIINNLFSETLKFGHLQEKPNSDSHNRYIFDLYASMWGVDFADRLIQKKDESTRQLAEIINKLSLGKNDLVNPITWVLEKENREAELTGYTPAITHGDLNIGNILIDQQLDCWLIDFERSGYGHVLRDFVEFECDIFVSLVGTSLNTALYDLSCLMVFWNNRNMNFLEPSSATPYTPELINNPQTLKFLYLVRSLRTLAGKIGVNDVRAYYWGLLMNALFCYDHYARDEQKQTRALLLASVIATRLRGWRLPKQNVEWRTQGWDKLSDDPLNKANIDEKVLYIALKKLDKNDIGSLCFMLGTSIEDFASESDPKEKIVRMLIRYCAKRELLAKLIEQVQKQYPNILRS